MKVEVVYLEKLAAEAIADKDVREQFIDDILAESQKQYQDMKLKLKRFCEVIRSRINR